MWQRRPAAWFHIPPSANKHIVDAGAVCAEIVKDVCLSVSSAKGLELVRVEEKLQTMMRRKQHHRCSEAQVVGEGSKHRKGHGPAGLGGGRDGEGSPLPV